MGRFINPYTFVAHQREPKRSAPAGHHRLDSDRYTGSLDVSVTARTPLLIGGFGNVATRDLVADEGAGPVPDVPRRGDGTAIIPGSSLMGAVRSLHEALAGGCLRVLNENYVPVHRHPAATAETKPVQLAVVGDVDDAGLPTTVAEASEVVWIPLALLNAAGGGGPHRTGDRLSIADAEIVADNGRRILAAGTVECRSGLSPVLDGSWVLLVTDTSARDLGKAVYFAAGLIGSSSRTSAVGEPAREQFGKCVDGTDDLRVYRQRHGRQNPTWDGAAPQYSEVRWPPGDLPAAGPVVGHRLPARPFFFAGQPVWVRVTDGVVTELRLSQLWRFKGDRTVGERAGAAGPCDDPTKLCPSCQVFGSIDAVTRLLDTDRVRGIVAYSVCK